MFQVQNQLTWGQGRTCPWARSSGAPPEPPVGPRAAVPDGPLPPARGALPAGLPAAGTASLWVGSVAPPSVAPSAVPPATSLAEPCPGLLADRAHALRLIGTR